MQNSPSLNKSWYLEVEDLQKQLYNDKIMGWTSSNETLSQVKLQFPDLASAEKYAKESSIEYEVIYSNSKKIRPKSYAENFK